MASGDISGAAYVDFEDGVDIGKTLEDYVLSAAFDIPADTDITIFA